MGSGEEAEMATYVQQFERLNAEIQATQVAKDMPPFIRWHCNGPTVCSHVFKFDTDRLKAIIETAKHAGGYSRAMKLLGMGSALRGDFTTAALGMGFGQTREEGMNCPECGWLNSWNDIAKGVDRLAKMIRDAKRLSRIMSDEEARNISDEEAGKRGVAAIELYLLLNPTLVDILNEEGFVEGLKENYPEAFEVVRPFKAVSQVIYRR
jgi:hypothetical protein